MQNIGLVEIFGHSKRHIFYDKLPVRVIRDDVVESYEMIEKTLDASRFFWSLQPESNRRPLPYQGSALPTEL